MTPLRQRMLHDMQIRNLADNTQKSYLLQVSSFALHFRRSPEFLGPEEIRGWLVYLREERKLAPSSLCPAIGALRFLYRVTLKRDWRDEDFPLPKKRVRLPVILSQDETTVFFESVASLNHRTVLMTAYAAGLRVSEVVHLKFTDIDSQRMVIRVNQGKNRKDRYVMLSPRLLDLRSAAAPRAPAASAACTRVLLGTAMRAPLEVADIFRHCGAQQYRLAHAGGLCLAQRRVMSAIALCRTAALGGHVEQCDACGHQRIAFNSCRHRCCPKCQSLARAQWLERRQAELFPEVEYFHVVSTLPEPIAALAYQERTSSLRHAVSHQHRHPAHDRRRSEAPGG